MIKEAVWEGAKRRSYWNDFLSRNGWVCPFFLLWQYFTLVSFLVLFELPWVSRSGAPLKYILFSFVFSGYTCSNINDLPGILSVGRIVQEFCNSTIVQMLVTPLFTWPQNEVIHRSIFPETLHEGEHIWEECGDKIKGLSVALTVFWVKIAF